MRDWEAALRAALMAFLDSQGNPVPRTATELADRTGKTPQHAYRWLYGYGVGSEWKHGLVTLAVPWVRCLSERRPKRFDLTDEGLRIARRSRKLASESTHSLGDLPVVRTRSTPPVPGYPFPGLPALAQRRLELARDLERNGRFQKALVTYISLGQDPAVQANHDALAYTRIRAAGICYLNRELDRALAFTKDAQHLLRRRGALWLQGELANLEGYLFNAFKKYVKAMDRLRKAEAIARGLKNQGIHQRILRAALNNQAYNLWERGHFCAAKRKFEEALRVAEQENDPRAVSAQRSALASFCLGSAERIEEDDPMTQLNRAKDHAELSVQSALEAKDHFQATIAYLSLGEVLEAMSSRNPQLVQTQKEAVAMYSKALRWALRIKNRKHVAASIGHLGIAHLRLQEGKRAEHAVQRLTEVAALPTLALTRKWWEGGGVHLRTR